mgnify:CR=1 FL=1
MFELELDEVLFKLAVNRPQFEPLFQLPPSWNTRFTVRLKDLISSLCFTKFTHLCGGENPPPPLTRGYKAGESQSTRGKRTKCSTNEP